MIIRNDVTAETYRSLPWSPADLRRLKKAFRVHAPDVELDRHQTETGEPFIAVMVPGADFDDAWPIITRSEVTGPDGASILGWRIHRGGNRPMYEFGSEQEVAEFFIPRVGHRFGCW